MLHALRNQTSYDLITGKLAGPIDLLAKRRQAEIHTGIARVILSPIFRKLLPQVVSCPLAILFPDKHAVA